MASTFSFLLMEIVRGPLVLGVYVVKRHGSGQKADQLLMNTMERGSYGRGKLPPSSRSEFGGAQKFIVMFTGT